MTLFADSPDSIDSTDSTGPTYSIDSTISTPSLTNLQVDEVAMGIPLGLSLTHFFLAHLEEYKFFNDKNIHPKLYVRYVDYLYSLFDKDVHFQCFFTHINNQHPNIKYTVEESEINELAFLDTQINMRDDEFQSCVFRKKTNNDVLLKNDAPCPVS